MDLRALDQLVRRSIIPICCACVGIATLVVFFNAQLGLLLLKFAFLVVSLSLAVGFGVSGICQVKDAVAEKRYFAVVYAAAFHTLGFVGLLYAVGLILNQIIRHG